MFTRKHFTKKHFTSKYFPRLDDEEVEGAMSATLAGSATLAAGITALGHMSADLSGSASVVGDLEEASATNDMSADLSGSSDVAAAATGIGHMSATLAGTGDLDAVAPVATGIDKSAGPYRRTMRVTPVVLRPLVLAMGRIGHTAAALVQPAPLRLRSSLGPVLATAQARTSTSAQRATLRIGYVRAQAAASAAPLSMRVAIGSRPVSAHAAALADVRGFSLLAHTGRVGTSVGPNVALADDEEVLFLLEVA
jgi:hypothetical protein